MNTQDILQCLVLSPELESFTTDIAQTAVVEALCPRLLPQGDVTPSIGLLDHLASMRVEASLEAAGIVRNETDSGPEYFKMDIDSPANITGGEGRDEDETEDISRYAMLCPNLEYFEVDDVDSIPLNTLCTLLKTRCMDFLPGIAEFAEDFHPVPTPTRFKTLNALILPYDEMYNMLSHPTIINRMNNSIWF